MNIILENIKIFDERILKFSKWNLFYLVNYNLKIYNNIYFHYKT